jgi:hypothetical protein
MVANFFPVCLMFCIWTGSGVVEDTNAFTSQMMV